MEIVNPGGTGIPRFVISARFAPLPPRRLRIFALPSSNLYTLLFICSPFLHKKLCRDFAQGYILNTAFPRFVQLNDSKNEDAPAPAPDIQQRSLSAGINESKMHTSKLFLARVSCSSLRIVQAAERIRKRLLQSLREILPLYFWL